LQGDWSSDVCSSDLKNADVRCDIYSMAATMYMMVTGELPFKACGPLDAWMKKINNEITAPRDLMPGLSERVDWAIRRSMSADPRSEERRVGKEWRSR